MSFSFAWAKLRKIFKLWHISGIKKTDSTYDAVSSFVVESVISFSECNWAYETSMALVTFSFGSVFGMVMVRMPSSTLAEI